VYVVPPLAVALSCDDSPGQILDGVAEAVTDKGLLIEMEVNELAVQVELVTVT
jgi:hypothetical protein